MKDIIFYNGDIITMDDENKFPEAVLVRDNIIFKVGKFEEIIQYKNENTEMVDLKGKTLMPGIIDPHSHITAYAQTLATVSLRDCTNIKDIVSKLKEYKENNNIKDSIIVGIGYDHNSLEEKRHPNKFDLDKELSENPIVIAHASGHMGVANSKALEMFKITDETLDSQGGKIGRVEGSKEPNGYLEENDFISRTGAAVNQTIEQRLDLLEKAQNDYLKNGITTCQDGLTKKSEWNLLKAASDRKKLKIDVVAYIDVVGSKNLLEDNKSYLKEYKDRLKIGGYKLILDGSPQGKTAWMTKPYEGEETYCGYPVKTDEEVLGFVDESVKNDIQLLTHCNGDAAADQLLKAFKKAEVESVQKTRPVLIHAQTTREDQLKECKKINMIPSFFVTHTYYWGDIHIKNLGERGYKISPVRTALDLGMKYTFHQDTPVILPNMLETVWSAVNRKTKSGITIGEEQKIDVYNALKAITIYAAYQYFEENVKGSIKEGKLADLVVLDKNPLKVDKADIKDIVVLETWKEGKKLYQY